MRTARILLALFALFATAAAACTDRAGSARSSPSSAFPSETGMVGTGPGSTGGRAPTGSTGVLPTTSPGAATGNLTGGELTFRLSGDVEIEKTLRSLITAVYSPPPGALAIVWSAGGADATVVGIGGATFTGSRPTSPTLSLSLTAETAQGIASFLSMDGECQVSIDVAGEAEVSGRVSCDDLVSSTGEVVDVSASFRASGGAGGPTGQAAG